MAKQDKKRCDWAGAVHEDYIAYHDQEWGVPVHDDRKQFEFLLLEGAQAGLSWWVVLSKREAYHEAFAEFGPQKVARFTPKRIKRLIQNPGIIRNRLKISAAVSNVRIFLEVQEEFGSFDEYIWRFVDFRPIQNRRRRLGDLPATTPQSNALSKDLK